jgi:CHAT domain-containing protein
MQEFYRTCESSATTKSEALRQAQLALLRGTFKRKEVMMSYRALMHENTVKQGQPESPRFELDSNSPFAQSSYRAPFFLMGNWL